MKPVSALPAFAYASLAAAQNVAIKAPAPQTTLSPGQDFVVEIDKDHSLILTRDVSLAIGLLSSADGGFDGFDPPDPSAPLGAVLYAGPYAPQSGAAAAAAFGQNLTVAVPADFPAGVAALTVAHFWLLGDGLKSTPASAQLELTNTTVVIG